MKLLSGEDFHRNRGESHLTWDNKELVPILSRLDSTEDNRTEPELMTSNQRDGQEARTSTSLGEIKKRGDQLLTQLRKHPCQTDDSSEGQERKTEKLFHPSRCLLPLKKCLC